ncbi:MAG: hypothetical protein KC496_19555, partial [Anaerolineae bacterium]|nr:hypothetical protein [Anaerolineae bacterium]
MLSEAGHEVTIFTAWLRFHAPHPARTESAARIVRVPVVFSKGPYPFGLKMRKPAQEKLFNALTAVSLRMDSRIHGAYDLIYAQGPSGMAGLHLRKFQKTPVVVASYNYNWGHMQYLLPELLPEINGLVALNHATMNYHREEFGSRLTPQQLVRSGSINTQRFSPANRSASVRESY